jgi:hypothetical protein
MLKYRWSKQVLQRRLTKWNSNPCAPAAAGQTQYQYALLITFSMHSLTFVPFFAFFTFVPYFAFFTLVPYFAFFTFSLRALLTLLPPVRIGRRRGRGALKVKRTEGSKDSKVALETRALAKVPYYKGKRALL